MEVAEKLLNGIYSSGTREANCRDSPKPQYLNKPRSKFEVRQWPQNCVEASKPALHDKKFEKECQPLKDVENEKGLRSPNHPKEEQKSDENYGKASWVPFWVNTRFYEKDQELEV